MTIDPYAAPTLSAAIVTPDWMTDAVCAQTGYGDLWYPPKGGKGTKEAVLICERCPVRKECLDYALDAEDGDRRHRAGIYGGTTPSQRRRIAAQRAREAA